MTRRISTAIALGVAIVLALVAPYVISDFYLLLLDQILIYALFALSLNVLMGYTGLTSLGHAGLFGVGAYACGYLTSVRGMPFLPTFILAIAASTGVSLLFGAIAVRTSGLHFLMITLAEGMLIYGLAFELYQFTGAENGLTGVNRPALFRQDWQYYYFSAAVIALCIMLLWRLARSPFGLTLRGIRESESRMRTLGYNVWLHKLIAFVISGTFAGIAGSLYAFYFNFVSVSVVQIDQSVEVLLMVIIGGVGTLFGPVLGAAIVLLLQEIVSLYTDRWEFVMGLVLTLVVIFARDGVLGAARRLLERHRPGGGQTPAGKELENTTVRVSN